MNTLKKAGQILLKSFNSFLEDNGFQDSAAVSFYTLFSLAPIVMIAVHLAGIFVGDASVLRELTRFLNETIGPESTDAVLLLVDTVQTESQSTFYLIISMLFLMVSATTVFIQFKDSFNRMFNVVAKSEVAYSKIIVDRLMAFGMILLLGVAMIFSLILDSLLAALFNLLLADFESAQILLVGLAGNLLTIIMIFFAILMMFYILPDVKMRWKPLIYGSLFTTFLLVKGKFLVGMIIGNSSLNQLSGASSSVIILMLWVYYSSIIVFFGVELVKALAEEARGEIKANRFARKIRMVEMPSNNKESEKS